MTFGVVRCVPVQSGGRRGLGRVGQLNVWDTPDQVSDRYVERLQPIIAKSGEPKDKPKRHGDAIACYVRPTG